MYDFIKLQLLLANLLTFWRPVVVYTEEDRSGCRNANILLNKARCYMSVFQVLCQDSLTN